MTGNKLRRAAVILIVSVSVVVAGGLPAAAAPRTDNHDLVAAAGPTPPQTSDTDFATAFERAHGRKVKADAVATATSDCDSCTASATTVQVIYLGKAKTASLHNVATAWSNCGGCRSTSVSVQLIVTRSSTSLTARNDALAVNVNCSSCATAAAAYQLIVVTDNKDHTLSARGRAQLKALALELAAQLQPASKSKAAARVAQAERLGGPRLDALIKQELQPKTVRRHLITTTG
jgi:hypothetical protein